MEFKPLVPGLYIISFNNAVPIEKAKIITDDFNTLGRKYGISFLPEKANLYQILRKEE